MRLILYILWDSFVVPDTSTRESGGVAGPGHDLNRIQDRVSSIFAGSVVVATPELVIILISHSAVTSWLRLQSSSYAATRDRHCKSCGRPSRKLITHGTPMVAIHPMPASKLAVVLADRMVSQSSTECRRCSALSVRCTTHSYRRYRTWVCSPQRCQQNTPPHQRRGSRPVPLCAC